MIQYNTRDKKGNEEMRMMKQMKRMIQIMSLMSYEDETDDETDDTDDEAGLQKEDIPQQVAQLFWFNFAPLSL